MTLCIWCCLNRVSPKHDPYCSARCAAQASED